MKSSHIVCTCQELYRQAEKNGNFSQDKPQFACARLCTNVTGTLQSVEQNRSAKRRCRHQGTVERNVPLCHLLCTFETRSRRFTTSYLWSAAKTPWVLAIDTDTTWPCLSFLFSMPFSFPFLIWLFAIWNVRNACLQVFLRWYDTK